MSIAESLSLLIQIKAEIKSAIEAKGQTVGDIPFSEYAGKIREIQQGAASNIALSSDESVVEDGDSISIALVSNTTWEYLGFTSTEQSSGTPTFSVSPTSGDGNSTVVVTLTDRDSAEGYFSLNFRTTDGEASAQFILAVQEATDENDDEESEASTISLSQSGVSLNGNAGTLTISLTSNTSWTLSEEEDWLSVSPISGTGNATITVTYDQNFTGTKRYGYITAATTDGEATSERILSQSSLTPSISLDSTIESVDASSGSLTIEVTSNTDWSVSEILDWVTVAPVSGSGNDSVVITYTENVATSSRSGLITFTAGTSSVVLTLTQAAAAVAPTFSFGSASSEVTDGAGSFTLDVISNTDWDITTYNTWLTVSPSSGSGNATVTVSYTTNTTSTSRSGSIFGYTDDQDAQDSHAVSQSAMVPTLAIDSTSESVTVSEGSFTVEVTSNTSWSVSESLDWVTVSPTSGSGNGSVTVSYEANSNTSSRSGVITFSTDTLSTECAISQAAASPYLTLDSTIESVDASSGSLTVVVSSNTNWTVSESLDWVTASPTSGSGNGSVTITYTENSVPSSRTGLITFSTGTTGKSFALTQAAAAVAPTFSFSSESSEVEDGAGTFTLDVTSNTSWSITTYNTWLTVSPSSGSGNATVTVSYTANTTSASRSGSIFGYTDDQDAQDSHTVSQAVALADGVYPISFNGDWDPVADRTTDYFLEDFIFCDATGLITSDTATSATIGYKFTGTETTSMWYTFVYCSTLTSITIPDSITILNTGVFRQCSSLQSVEIPSSVTSIGAFCFQECTSLTYIKLPAISALQQKVLYGCTSLTTIDLTACTVVPTLGTDPLTLNEGLQILVSQDMLSAFQSNSSWISKGYTSYLVGVTI